MEFLNNFNQTTSYDNDIEFYSYKTLISGIHGAPNISNYSFSKLQDLYPLLNENNGETEKYLIDSNEQSSGIRMIFKSDSPELVLKAHLKRAWAHQNIMLFCSSGFDVYQVKDGQQKYLTVIAPQEPNNIFVHKIAITPNLETIIYFPTFNAIIDLEIGVKKGFKITPCSNFYVDKPPVVFYGNSCTQGASASRSGNAYPNIISRKTGFDIINYSFSGACRAEKSMAEFLSNLEMTALIVDYTRNANSLEEFSQRYLTFYEIIRMAKPNIPIILIGAFNETRYDDRLKKIFEQIKKTFSNTFYINLNLLFNDINVDDITADSIHYTDKGMYSLADKIIEYLNQVI